MARYKTHRDRWLAYKYDITEDQYKDMLQDQKGCCAICNTYMISPHVDHDHETGLVRALLCAQCNMGLGMFKDNIKILAYAIVYLEKYGKKY